MSNPAQVIRPPNTLRMKVGGTFGGIDAGAIAKAEAALKAMSSQFGQWLQDEIVKLDAAQATIRSVAALAGVPGRSIAPNSHSNNAGA